MFGFGGGTLRAGPPPDLSLDLAATRNLLERGTDEERAKALRRLERADDASWAPLVHEALGSTPPPANAGGLMSRLADLKDPGKAWSAKQATGAPDTPLHGDYATAWAPKLTEMGEVTLDLVYPQAVRVDGVSIHETLNPGCVARIFAWTPEGTWELLWEGTGARSEAPVWFSPPVRVTSYATSKLRIILDTDRVPGWNEIDAVELIGDGIRQWASEATRVVGVLRDAVGGSGTEETRRREDRRRERHGTHARRRRLDPRRGVRVRRVDARGRDLDPTPGGARRGASGPCVVAAVRSPPRARNGRATPR